MSDTNPTTIGELLQEGRAATLAGDSFAARAAFRQATEREPTNAEAWIGLSGATPILADKRTYLRRALELEPEHTEARASLEYVEKLIGEGMQLAPAQRTIERRISADASPLLSAPEPDIEPVAEKLVCYIHPDRETGLRCTQCNRPICGQCAQLASVGQLCPECRKARRPPNYQYNNTNLVVAGVLAVGMGLICSIGVVLAWFVPFIGLFLSLMLGPLVGELTVRVSDRFTRMKRGRGMQIAVALGVILGTLPLIVLLFMGQSFQAVVAVLYLVLAVVTIARRLR